MQFVFQSENDKVSSCWVCIGLVSKRISSQHSTAQHSTAQHSTADKQNVWHGMAWHGLAPYSAAQRSTVQHSTTQHRNAQHYPTSYSANPSAEPTSISASPVLFDKHVALLFVGNAADRHKMSCMMQPTDATFVCNPRNRPNLSTDKQMQSVIICSKQICLSFRRDASNQHSLPAQRSRDMQLVSM